MITSFEVGAVFTIQNDGAETLASMAEQFGRLDELARGLQASIDAISKDGLTNLTSGIDRLSGMISGLEETARTATTTMSGGFDGVTASIGRAIDQADDLRPRLMTAPPRRPIAWRRMPAAAGCSARGATLSPCPTRAARRRHVRARWGR